jgi:hypothetical protein
MTKTELERELKDTELRLCQIRRQIKTQNLISPLSAGGAERMMLATQLDIAEQRRARLKAEIIAKTTDADRRATLRQINASAPTKAFKRVPVGRKVPSYVTRVIGHPGRG